jgi:hypothetical protein
MKGFPKYVSEDMREAYEKRYHDHDKRQFDDPIIAEMYKNETRSYFSQDSFNSINFSIYPKNLNLEHNFVKVSIPFKENNSQQIKRYLIRSTELLNNESLKEAKSYPLIDYDYENYIKNQKLVRYLKKKSKTTTAKSTTISNKNTSHEKIRSEKVFVIIIRHVIPLLWDQQHQASFIQLMRIVMKIKITILPRIIITMMMI